jgi:hypothetical protein
VSTKRELELELERVQTGGVDVRVALPVMLLTVLLAVGVAPQMGEQLGHPFSPLFTALAALPMMFAGWRLGGVLWPYDIYGYKPDGEWHYLVVAAGLFAAVIMPCVGYFGLAAVWWPMAGGVAMFALLLAGICLGAPRHAEKIARKDVEEYRHEVDALWRAIFDASDLAAIEIAERREWESRAGFTLICGPHPNAAKRATFAQFVQALPAVVTNADYMLKRHDGTRIGEDCIIPEKGVGGSEFLLNVRTVDVFKRVVDYPVRETPGDIQDGLPDVGLAQDGEIVNMTAAHAKIVGASGGGKTNLANVMIARTTQTANAMPWICGSDKLVTLVFPWLLPWLEGRTDWPVIDYIAGQDRKRILMMLRNALLLCDERNRRNRRKSKREPTADEPTIIIYFEETSHAVEDDKTVIVCHDGLKRNISGLLYAIGRAGRSANIWIKLMTQVNLYGAIGSHGPELMRMLGERVVLRTYVRQDGDNSLHGLPVPVNTTLLRDFSGYIQPSIEEARAVPWKPYLLDGDDMIVPVAERNTAWTPQLEEGSQLWDEPGYRDRWWPEALEELFEAVEDEDGCEWRVWPEQTEDAGDVATEYDPAAAEASVDREAALDGADRPDEVDDELRAMAEEERRRMAEEEPPARPSPRPRGHGSGEPLTSDRTEIPGATETLDKMRGFVDRVREEADRLEAERLARTAGNATERTGELYPVHPIPEPLAAVIGWLDRTGYAADWVRTGELAEQLHADDPVRFGRELGALVAVVATNVPRRIDARQRKGYRITDLREAADRHRLGR